ncbi:MAG: PLD nuclease N-terminal domain-containing protein [Dehalococcoidia bacterium]|nr:PLD nuclease N-terminal domain-containing protein [Dehalococcoidia bacterium]
MFGRTKRKKSWSDLTPQQQRGVGLAAIVQVALLLIALVDWFRRPSDEMRGRKLLWLPLLFVNFFGPLAYLKFGRLPVRHG